MEKSISLLILWLLYTGTLSAQSVSDIRISKDGSRMAFLKQGDSLFIKNLATNENSKLIDSGLKSNGNQRFLNWTRDSKSIVYEKNENIWVYNLGDKSTKQVPHQYQDSLSLFKWYLIRQTSVSDKGELFFSAALKSGADPTFQLFRLNLGNGAVKQLTNSPLTVSNVSVSGDNRYVAYASYAYSDNVPQTIVTIISANTGETLTQTELYNDCFFSELKWSDDGSTILAIDSGNNSQLLTFDSRKKSIAGRTLKLGAEESPVDFFNRYNLLYSVEENGKKGIGIYDLNKGTKKAVVEDVSDFLALVRAPGERQLFFLKESPTLPKAISVAKIKRAGDVRISEVHAFRSNNPLGEYAHVNYRYNIAGGGSMESQVYFPKGYAEANEKKYPLLVIPYGGYDNSYPDFGYFLNQLLFDYLGQGYILAFPNTRGIDYERQSDNYGRLQLEDTEKFIRELSKSYSVDRDRIVAVGHSHGATMVYYYLTHSALFSGGIAVNGASDWIRQAERRSMAGLPYGMGGMPAEHEGKYKEFSPLENIGQLRSPMLIIAGKEDTQIPYDINAVSFYNRAKERGKQVKLVVFDDEGHLIDKVANKAAMRQEFQLFLENKK